MRRNTHSGGENIRQGIKNVTRAAAIIMVLSLLSKILCSTREAAVALSLGTGFSSEAYYMTRTIPRNQKSLLMTFLASGLHYLAGLFFTADFEFSRAWHTNEWGMSSTVAGNFCL